MRINLIPLYVWYVLVAAAMIVFAFPPLIAGSMLLELRARFRLAVLQSATRRRSAAVAALVLAFRPSRGLHHFFAVGGADCDDRADLLSTTDRRLRLGRVGRVGTGFLSFGLWVHHMFTTGLPGITLGLFSAASQAVALPTGVQIFCLSPRSGRGGWSIRCRCFMPSAAW